MGFLLYFNNETNRVYSRPSWLTGHGTDESTRYYDDIKVPWLIYDFMSDDKILSGGNTPWSGFSSNEVYLSIYGKGISDTADVFVTSIDGIDLNQECFVDQNGPTINIDTTDLIYNKSSKEYSAPFAEVNAPYKTFAFNAFDSESEVALTSVKVLDENGNVVPTNNNVFTPTSVGTYSIVYSAKDVYNNETIKTIDVNVVDDLEELQMSLSEDLPLSISLKNLPLIPDGS